ncbi:Non-repetitive/WGA-negative nucleoporin C-terminal-domain-containing protein [Tricladium varicosporioides]|nr:Non-repetitive/WGA-negative nucleoporin C-terminal-domain-containing protein [Hymenoscyphus varicosporioides]
MFTAAGANPTPSSTRTGKRRPRPLSNEGSIPKAKRQRSALSDHTFIAPDNHAEMQEAKAYKPAALSPREVTREVSGQHKEIPVRGKKTRSGDRNSKGDGSVVLTTNDTYTVSKLPALPDRLRANTKERQHGAIYSDSGYALSLTHTHAIVWPYAVNAPSPETFTFAIPQPSKHFTDPLPLGSLVSASASSSEPGLVVVVPTTGRITYWESIASAATLDLRLQRNGVELSISGMYSGETVIQILNAESAGFMLAFSSGRIAFMSVRDSQGRPAVSVQFLRSGSGSASGGLFGSVRNALSRASSHGDIAAVRAGQPGKVGERNVVLATSKGKIQSWDINRSGHTSLVAETEVREAIVLAIKETIRSMSELLIETFEILDFAHIPNPLEPAAGQGTSLLLLTSLGDRQTTHYTLVEILLKPNETMIGNIRPIKSYTTPVMRTATSNPRLYLPSPGLVGFAVFDRAVVVVSMVKQPDSPEMQLITESHFPLQTFEDVIDFRKDMNVEIVGSGMEEPNAAPHGIEDSKSRRHKAKYPATVLVVRGGGVLRIAATNVTKLASKEAQKVTAKSKLEQAVFFGNLEHNPINFAVRSELEFTPEEVGEAALDLSRDILKSQTPYIPSVPGSIDQNLRKRSAALHDLAEYLKQSGVELDRVTRWKLLWDAERLEAAIVVWNRYDALVREKPVGQKRGLLTEVVEWIHEDYKTEPVPEAGELDRVRHWFINDIWNLEIALPWAFQVIKYTYQDGQKDHVAVMETLSEANDFVIGALQGAFNFRTANLRLYGLQSEPLYHGILSEGYEVLPQFWTSAFFGVENLRKQIELAGVLLTAYIGKPAQEGQPSVELIDKIKGEHGLLIDMSIRAHNERVRWSSVQDDPQLQIEAEQMTVAQETAVDGQLKQLAKDLGSPGEAILLAEKHEILPTLAYVLMYELNECSRKANANSKSEANLAAQDINDDQSAALKMTVRQCFNKFGKRWADALYGLDIELDSMNVLLDGFPEEFPYLTTYLRNRQDCGKIAWIHEVTRNKDFDQASMILLDLGLQREQDLWSKKIELSIGKLARLAGKNYSQKDGIIIPDGGNTELTATHNELSLIKIQDTVYEYILPAIAAAIDDNAELQLALEAHGNKLSRKQPAFSSLLKDKMGHLVRHIAMKGADLVDLLTLMEDNDYNEDYVFRGERFYLALKASQHGIDEKEERLTIQRMIWRRCMLRDDWSQVNNTDMKDDSQIQDQLRQTALYLTFKNCLKNNLFNKKSSIKPIKPQEILGAYTDGLDRRFDGLDVSFQERIMKDFEVEDDAFKVYIERCRLENWHTGALELAQQDFAQEMAEETEDGSKMRQAKTALQEAEEAISKKEQTAAENLLRGKMSSRPRPRLNGSFTKSVKY